MLVNKSCKGVKLEAHSGHGSSSAIGLSSAMHSAFMSGVIFLEVRKSFFIGSVLSR